MRILLVNHCHPDTPHICATRMREFARALAARGHRVALLTETLRGAPSAPSPGDIAELLKAGQEPSPMVVACAPKRRMVLTALRRGLWPWGIRQGMIAYQYLRHGGLFADWRAGAKPYAQVLADHFKPDVVWASFGSTDCWRIAQDIAGRAGCPWVADIKDFWASFIPGPLRERLAARYRDAAAWTAFSQTHADRVRPWFGSDFHIIYSGFTTDTIREDEPAGAGDTLLMTLTGSVYGGTALKPLLGAIAAWASRQSDEVRKRLMFIYRGNAQYEVGAALARAKLPFQAKAGGFVPVDELQELHRHAFVNLYVTSPRTFHHKTIELLAARRPILAFPPDHDEANDIVERAGGVFRNCRSDTEIGAALDDALARFGRDAAPVPDGLRKLSWDAQAAELEILFERIARR